MYYATTTKTSDHHKNNLYNWQIVSDYDICKSTLFDQISLLYDSGNTTACVT